MKTLHILSLFIFSIHLNAFCQDKAGIERAAMDYIEGFYVGDTAKIKRSIHPDLSKYGYSKDEKTQTYKEHLMTYKGAIQFAREVFENPQWAAPKDAIKKIEILDMQDKIASVKVTAYWGIDYLLLAKYEDKWMITKVLWQEVEE